MHISTRLILGGSQENTILSCEGQAALGHDVALVFGPIYGPEGSLLERVKGHGGYEWFESPHLVRQLHPFRDSRCYRDLRRLMRQWKPDVVHTHSSKAGILGRIAAWIERVPCVMHTIHGPPFHQYEKAWRNALYAHSERVAAKRCHVIGAVAQAMRDQFLEKRIGRPEQYVVVYSGMEVNAYIDAPKWRDEVRRELGFQPEDFVIGTVARLAENKGHDDLLNALGGGASLRANPRVRMLWVGDGWWRERLLKRAGDLGFVSGMENGSGRQRVITTGLVPSERIPRYLAAMDLLVHPSYREGLPRTVTQALLAGLPVVAYDVDGTREVCIDGKTGRLVRAGDVAGLREAIAWMMAHPVERAAMGAEGRELCRIRFAAETMVAHLQAIYDACLRGERDVRGIAPPPP